MQRTNSDRVGRIHARVPLHALGVGRGTAEVSHWTAGGRASNRCAGLTAVIAVGCFERRIILGSCKERGIHNTARKSAITQKKTQAGHVPNSLLSKSEAKGWIVCIQKPVHLVANIPTSYPRNYTIERLPPNSYRLSNKKQ